MRGFGVFVAPGRNAGRSKGKLLHRVTYYSHYARITGITLVGR